MDDLKSLEKTFGYTSYDSRIDEVIDELDFVTTKAEFNLFKKKYQNYMTTKIRDNEESYERIIIPNMLTHIANENGLYYIGDTAYRVIGEYLISSEIKKINQLLMVGYDNILKNGGKQDFKTIKYINSHEQNINSFKSTTTYLGNNLIASAVNPDGDRKVILKALSDIITLAGGYNYFTNIYA